jgi:hypothetical protein
MPDKGILGYTKVDHFDTRYTTYESVIMLIHTLHMSPRYSLQELFRGPVVIHLETNRLQPRVRVTQKARPLMYRAKVLGRALVSAFPATSRLAAENFLQSLAPSTKTQV